MEKLYAQGKLPNVAYLSPPKSVLKDTEIAMQKIYKEQRPMDFDAAGSMRLRSIVESTKEQYDTNLLRLARLFVLMKGDEIYRYEGEKEEEIMENTEHTPVHEIPTTPKKRHSFEERMWRTAEKLKNKETVWDIAKAEGIDAARVVEHISALHERGELPDVRYIRPSEEILKDVQQAVEWVRSDNNAEDLTQKGEIRLAVLRHYTLKHYGWTVIRLSEFFLRLEERI